MMIEIPRELAERIMRIIIQSELVGIRRAEIVRILGTEVDKSKIKDILWILRKVKGWIVRDKNNRYHVNWFSKEAVKVAKRLAEAHNIPTDWDVEANQKKIMELGVIPPEIEEVLKHA